MPRLAQPLSDAQVKRAKAGEKLVKLFDGNGLYLEVQPSGAKFWRLRYRQMNGKETTNTFGPYPEVSLADARNKRTEARRVLLEGGDRCNSVSRHCAQVSGRPSTPSARSQPNGMCSSRSRGRRPMAHNVLHRLEMDIFPDLGRLPIDEVTHRDLIDVFRKIESRGAHEIAKRNKAVCAQIFSYAIQTGVATRNPVADTETHCRRTARFTGNRAFSAGLPVCFCGGFSNVRPADHAMDITKRNHYNPCFWTALWNFTCYEKCIAGVTLVELARKQVVHVLNAKSQRIYPVTVERVHYDKNLGIAKISKSAAENFVRRYHPDRYERFISESGTASYPVYLDFENILSGIEATPAYQTLLKVATTRTVDNLIEKCYLASFVVLQNLRSHSMMNTMIDWHEEIGREKFEHLVTLKWT
jgi:hypothetical protein